MQVCYPLRQLTVSTPTKWGLLALDRSHATNKIISILSFEIPKDVLPRGFPIFDMNHSFLVYENNVRMWRADNMELATDLVEKHKQRL